MDLKESLQEEGLEKADEDDEVYPGRVLRGEDIGDRFKLRYAKGKAEKNLSRYSSSLRHMILVRPSKRNNTMTPKIDQSGLLSFITYSWIFPYLWSAFKGRLSKDQIWECSMYDSSAVNSARIEYLWKQEVEKNPSNPSLLRVVWYFIRTRLIVAIVVFFFCLVFGFIGPTCLVHGLVSFAETGRDISRSDDETPEHPNVDYSLGFLLVLSILIVEMARVLSYGGTWAVSSRTGIRLRGALLAILYKKLMNAKTLGKRTAAEIVNMYANDGQRLFDAITFMPLVLVGPMVIVGGMIYLSIVIGRWSWLGILVFLAFDILQVALGKTMVRYRNSAVAKTEQRISLMGEIIRCIRVIKVNVWEESFREKIEGVRYEEMVNLRTAGYAQSLAIASGPVVPAVAAIFTFLAVILSGGDLLASDAFSAITVFFVMLFGIRMIPYGSRYCAEAYVAIKRIREILLIPEYDAVMPHPQNPNVAVEFQNATFVWEDIGKEKSATVEETERIPVISSSDENNQNLALERINLAAEKKELIGICGPVGSGKTALLESILGHTTLKDGALSVADTVAYVAQTPWIQNLSVRANILFGLPMCTKRYYRTVTACELTKDLETMKAGDITEIGERGVTLSGGQKARIAIARALFANRQIYLLDDVFASLDQRVADRVFQHGVKEMLSSKTVLMVSNDIQRLSRCDRVVYMESKRIVGVGPHEKLLEDCEAYSLFCNRSLLNDPSQNAFVNMYVREEKVAEPDMVAVEMTSKPRSTSSLSDLQASNPNSLLDIPTSVDGVILGNLVEEEENSGISIVKWPVYRRYILAAGGYLMWTFLLLAFIINVFSTIFTTAWLSHWMKSAHVVKVVDESGQLTRSVGSLAETNNAWFATVYGSSLLFLFTSGILKAFIFVKASLNAASRLHNDMFRRIIRAPIQFFDMTPSGRILNRFSKDMDEVDVKLPFTTEVFLQNTITCIGYLVMIIWVFPVFTIACVPLCIVFMLFLFCFRAGITGLKRSENISRSPLFNHITASVDGLSTIHSFGQTERFVEGLKTNLDINSAAMFMYQSAMRWLAVWLDLLVVAVTFVVSFLIVLFTGMVAPADAGMALAFAIQMSGIFQFAVRTQTELEAKMTSVERIVYYCDNIESENVDPQRKPSNLSNDWPTDGRIELKDVKLRYRLNLPLALDGISLTVEPREKIGIIGRTGSGKTSLCSVLYRLHRITSGEAYIDGVNIEYVDLRRLRRSMAIIPQDPILFAGTLRFNLDPSNEYSDEQLWDVLEKTHLKETFVPLGIKLDHNITESGRNLSIGERQLLCMARAILRQVHIVILDEATGSLDSATNQRIHKCLEEVFAKCTVLVISHRLENIGSLDKILFMDQGKCVEFDKVTELLNNRNSSVYKLFGEDRLLSIKNIKEEVEMKDNDSNSHNDSSQSSPVQLYPVLCRENSGKTSPETSEFEKVSESISKITNMSGDISDLEIIGSDTDS